MSCIQTLGMVVVTAVVVSAVAAETPVPREWVISYWSGDCVASGQRLDEVGSNHLSYSTPKTTAPGKIGLATDFSGANFLRTSLGTDTNASSLTSVGADISYAGWIRFDTIAAEQTIAGRWGGWAPGREHRLFFDSAAKSLTLVWANDKNTTRQTVADKQAIIPEQWYFVAYGRRDTTGELWLSVTPDNEPAARPRLIVASAPTNPTAQSQPLEFGANDKSNPMDGRWNQWGIYRCTLTEGDVNWLFHAGSGRSSSELVYRAPPKLEYLHDFEQVGAAAGRYSLQSFMPNATISSEQAHGGMASLKVNGSWGQIQVFNNSNTNYWCTTDECKVSADIYAINCVGGGMWFQMDGKSNHKDLDTNEGVGVNFYSEGGNRGFAIGGLRTAGYNLPLKQWVHLTYLFRRQPAAGENVHELYADGMVIAKGGSAGPAVVARAWHHISLGNDRLESPTHYLDNFSVRPTARLNDPPDVHAGADQATTVGAVLALDGNITDIDGDHLTSTWSKISGPGAATFVDPSAVDTSVTCNAEGVYVLRLSATDAKSETSHEVTVTVRPLLHGLDSRD